MSVQVGILLDRPMSDRVWLCIEDHPDGPRITNLPGGPGKGMCYFTGQGSSHLPDCGFVDLDVARRVANLDIDAVAKLILTQSWRWVKGHSSWEHAFYQQKEAARIGASHVLGIAAHHGLGGEHMDYGPQHKEDPDAD